jgi:hypothetical protein
MIRFTTETGSTYEIDGDKVRRVGEYWNAKRADGEWVRLAGELPEVVVGEPVTLILESLSAYGPDDDGVENSPSPVTFRKTSRVKSVLALD